MPSYFIATDLPSGLTYMVEHARARSHKLNAHAMRARIHEGMSAAERLDYRVAWGKVPLYLRRAAREALG